MTEHQESGRTEDAIDDGTEKVSDDAATGASQFDVGAFLKWQKDANRQLKQSREQGEKLESILRALNGNGQTVEKKEPSGITSDELHAFGKFQRMLGSLPEEAQAMFEDMEGSYAERSRAVEFFVRGMKSISKAAGEAEKVADPEGSDEPETRTKGSATRKKVVSKPESVGTGAGIPSFRTIQEYYKAKPEDRDRWKKAGNSPSQLPTLNQR